MTKKRKGSTPLGRRIHISKTHSGQCLNRHVEGFLRASSGGESYVISWFRYKYLAKKNPCEKDWQSVCWDVAPSSVSTEGYFLIRKITSNSFQVLLPFVGMLRLAFIDLAKLFKDWAALRSDFPETLPNRIGERDISYTNFTCRSAAKYHQITEVFPCFHIQFCQKPRAPQVCRNASEQSASFWYWNLNIKWVSGSCLMQVWSGWSVQTWHNLYNYVYNINMQQIFLKHVLGNERSRIQAATALRDCEAVIQSLDVFCWLRLQA